MFQYQTRSSVKEIDAYSVAGKQAEEVLKSVKTVVAYSGEDKEIERFCIDSNMIIVQICGLRLGRQNFHRYLLIVVNCNEN